MEKSLEFDSTEKCIPIPKAYERYYIFQVSSAKTATSQLESNKRITFQK